MVSWKMKGQPQRHMECTHAMACRCVKCGGGEGGTITFLSSFHFPLPRNSSRTEVLIVSLLSFCFSFFAYIFPWVHSQSFSSSPPPHLISWQSSLWKEDWDEEKKERVFLEWWKERVHVVETRPVVKHMLLNCRCIWWSFCVIIISSSLLMITISRDPYTTRVLYERDGIV